MITECRIPELLQSTPALQHMENLITFFFFDQASHCSLPPFLKQQQILPPTTKTGKGMHGLLSVHVSTSFVTLKILIKCSSSYLASF